MYQKVWLKLITMKNYKPQPDAKFSTFLYTVLSNTCKDHWREKKKRGEVIILDNEIVKVTPDKKTEDNVHSMELKVILQDAIKTLCSEQREIFIMHNILGLTLKEIAEILGYPEGTVGSRKHYALINLKKYLQENYDLEELF